MPGQGSEDSKTMSGEHQVQVGLLRALADAIRNNASDRQKTEILEQLIDYTDLHFASEQLLMRLHAYPQFDAHVAEHDRLMGDVQELRRLFEQGHEAQTLELLETLDAWLTKHIQSMDQAFARYIDSH